ncbi:TadE/TadG family type IV pilus assembly protein [Yoonia sp. R2-816]|uniref:TadE/TadG family type IV pilus assembly protein n=1 Tax=Yoonia sp. R2-816 TaxID=3342638 RepID=UPI0037289911
MMFNLRSVADTLKTFARDEDGTASLEFVLAFPIFMLFFGMTYENGMISLRHVMLERGVDLAVRDIRIGRVTDPSRERIKTDICDYSLIIPDCMNQLQLEVLVRDPHTWVAVPPEVTCVDRGDPDDADNTPNVLGNNQLVFLKACARFDPVMPTTGIGRAITKAAEGDTAAGGSYALVTRASFVIEPFKRENTGGGT